MLAHIPIETEEGLRKRERVMNELGDAAYTLHLVGHEPYEY